MDPRFVTFLAVSTLLIVAPGPDMALVTRNALAYGRRAASMTGLGVCIGILVWAAASAAGVGILLERSVVAFTVLKLAGAAYLFYLGVKSLLGSVRSGETADASSIRSGKGQISRWEALKGGILCNLLNPKAAVIWVSILPQFVRPGDGPPRLVLMLIAFEVIALVWLNLYGYLVSAAGASRAGTRFKQRLEGVTGLVLIGLGLRLAIERR